MLFFIDRSKVPEDRWKDITYRHKTVCNVCPRKAKTNQRRLMFSRNNIVTAIDCRTPTANLLTLKLLLNSVISTTGAKFLGLDPKGVLFEYPYG